jgi:hypothetical protein
LPDLAAATGRALDIHANWKAEVDNYLELLS